jgi:hypothetical protein
MYIYKDVRSGIDPHENLAKFRDKLNMKVNFKKKFHL